MKFIILVIVLGNTFIALNANAMFNDDPWLRKVAGEFEYLNEDNEQVLEWDIDVWSGRDLTKFWLKSSGEYSDSEFEGANLEFVYSRAVSPYWDQQFGIRHDFRSGVEEESRNWISYGFIGTAPYFIEADARVFVGEESSTQLLIELEREIMLTQQWVLTSELDILANGRTNERFGEGSGLAKAEFSIRLGYESVNNRKLQPFIGLAANQKYGTTRRLAKDKGEDSADLEAKIGIHFWF